MLGKKIKEYAKASFSGAGPIGWLVWLFKPIARGLNMLGDVDLLGNYLGGAGKFLASGWGTLACVVVGAVIVGSAILHREHTLAATNSGPWRVPKITNRLEPKHLIIVGVIGVLVFAAIALAGVILQSRNNTHVEASHQSAVAPSVTDKPVNQVVTNSQHRPIYRVDEIEEMLGVLRKMRSIVDDETTPAYEATQNIPWENLLKTGGAGALSKRLASIRDPLRQAGRDMRKLFYDNRHYGDELLPVAKGYEFAYDWMDSSLSMIIDTLNKYSTATPDVLNALIRDRYIEWANGIGTHFSPWYGAMDSRITAKTKELREWPNLAERAPASEPRDAKYTTKTIRELRAMYEGRTRLQADAFISGEKGKLIDVDGIVENTDSGMVFLYVGTDPVECRLDVKWNTKLATFRKGDRIKVRGVIGPTQNGAQIYLQNCEIIQ